MSIKTGSNKLEFNNEVNQNNYSKLFLVDKNGNEQESYVAVNKNFANSINTSLEIEDAFQSTSNNAIRNLSLLNIFTQATSGLENLLGQKNIYTQSDFSKMSQDSYWHNYNRFNLIKYKNGDPDQIEDTGLEKVFIAFQDQNPFEMSYNQIFNDLSKMITEKQLTKKELLINSILAKTSNEDYWSEQNTKFSNSELSILKDYSGVENNSWLFYTHYYYSLIKNKLVKLKQDLSTKFGDKVGEFIWFILNDNKYNNNLIKFNTLYPRDMIHNRFPMIGAMDENEDADLADIMFFKKELIHATGNDTHPTFKILEKNNAGYVPIDLSFLKVKTMKEWETYIDDNKELVNLKNLYSKLFKQDNNIESEYQFSNNVDDIYQINRIVQIEQTPWISNVWIHIMAIIFFTIFIVYYTNKISFKKEGKYVE